MDLLNSKMWVGMGGDAVLALLSPFAADLLEITADICAGRILVSWVASIRAWRLVPEPDMRTKSLGSF